MILKSQILAPSLNKTDSNDRLVSWSTYYYMQDIGVNIVFLSGVRSDN